MMFHFTKNTTIAALLMSPLMSVQAQTAITFTGKVIDTACTVTVNEGNATVEIGTTAGADISAAGQTGAPKEFTVALTACPAAGGNVPTTATITFDGSTDGGGDTYFKNTATTDPASKVGVLIKDPAGTAIISGAKNEPISLPVDGGDLTLTYTASLVATAATPTKGNVSAPLTYTVGYQ